MTNATKQAAYKARKRAAGLSEVRGIWARPEDHEQIKTAALSVKVRAQAERDLFLELLKAEAPKPAQT